MMSLTSRFVGLALLFSAQRVLAVGPSCANVALEDELSLLQVNMNQHKAIEANEALQANDGEASSIDVFSHDLIIREGDMRPATSEEAAGFLKATNMYRCMHGSSAVKWSDAVAQGASKYITPQTEMIHSKMYEVPPPAGPAAENLGSSSNIPTPAEQVARWGEEYKNCADYPKLSNGCAESTLSGCPVGHAKSDGSCHIGHFTALVWQGTKTIGCAYSKQTNPQLIICRYKALDTKSEETPNFNKKYGAYPKHVFRQSKTKEQCGGTSGSSSSNSGGSVAVGRVVSKSSPVVQVVKKKTPVAQVVQESRRPAAKVASTATSCGKSATCEPGTKCRECRDKCGGEKPASWGCSSKRNSQGTTFPKDICECR